MYLKFVSFLFFFIISFELHVLRAQFTQLGLISQWNMLEFDFPSIEHRQLAILQGKYIKGNSVPIDVDLDYSGKLQIITVKGFRVFKGGFK